MENLPPIPYGRQSISEQDIEAVVEVLKSDWLTQGPAIERFEKAVADYCGVEFAVAVSNATAALHISCLSLGLGEGDILWTVPNTFVASANCGLYCGAKVDFVDIDPRTYTISIVELREKLQKAESLGCLPKVLVPVHFSGQSCEMNEIAELSKRFGFRVLEDASHAIGGRFDGVPTGSCQYSDLTVFSFHPVKIITTGEGGMVVTRNRKLYESLKLLRSHGVTREPSQMKSVSHGPWYYEQVELGFNYRMTDIQAALGSSQIQRLDSFVERRHDLANRYDRLLTGLPVVPPYRRSNCQSSHHLYVVRLQTEKLKKSQSEIFAELRKSGIGVNLHYIPVHLQPYYRALGHNPGDFPVAESYYAQAMSLPLYFGMTEEDQDRVVSALRLAVKEESDSLGCLKTGFQIGTSVV